MHPILRASLVLLCLGSSGLPARATEYVVAAGVAMPGGRGAETVSMIGARHLLPAGLLGEAALLHTPAGPCVATLASVRPWPRMRAGAGLLALRARDASRPSAALPAATAGFQIACGLQLPLSSGLGVDFDARYVCFERPDGQAAPDRFASRYWTITLGLAVLGEKGDRDE